MKPDRPIAAQQKRTASLTVNGAPVEARVDGATTLVDALRGLGVTGVRAGCRNGDCGTCTALVDDACVKTCLVPAGRADGCAIRTLEGLGSEDDPHPVQLAFMETYAFQCGFCLPGMVFAAITLLERVADPDESQIRDALSGNLCRCTGYENFVRGVRRARELMNPASSPT